MRLPLGKQTGGCYGPDGRCGLRRGTQRVVTLYLGPGSVREHWCAIHMPVPMCWDLRVVRVCGCVVIAKLRVCVW